MLRGIELCDLHGAFYHRAADRDVGRPAEEERCWRRAAGAVAEVCEAADFGRQQVRTDGGEIDKGETGDVALRADVAPPFRWR